MKLSRRTLVVLVFLTAAVATPLAFAATTSLFQGGEQVSGDIVISASNGPQVNVTNVNELELSNFTPDQNTVEVTSNRGNATLSSPGPTEAQLGQITGTWTNVSALDVSSDALTVDPADKPAFTVTGDADSVSVRDTLQADDGQTDFVYAGASGSTTLTLRGLAGDQQLAAVDRDTNTVLDVTTTSQAGTATFVLSNSEHDVTLQTTQGAPELSDPIPDGPQSGNVTNLSVYVDDPDFPNDSVTVTAQVDGSQVGQQTVTSAGRVNFSVSGLDEGSHNVNMTAEDAYGQTDALLYDVGVPNTLYIRNETDPSQLVNGTGVNVSVTFYGQQDTVVERSTSDGTLNMSGLPPDETFVVEANAAGYHPRTIIVDSLIDQQTVYMLNESLDTVLVEFELEDNTGGQFSGENVSLRVEKAIEENGTTEYRTIAGDFLDSTGSVSVFLQRDARYRLVAQSPTQTRRLGSYTATTAGTETVPIGQVQIGGEIDRGYTLRATTTTDDGGQDFVQIAYRDPEEQTTSLTATVYRVTDSGETQIAQRSVTTVTLGTYTEAIPVANKTGTFRVEIEAQRDGETITDEALVGEVPNVTSNWPISSWVLELLGMVFIVAVGGLLVIYDSSLAALGMVAVATIFTAMGIVSLPIWALGPAAAVALLFLVGDRGVPT